ncbi:MAG: glycosyltransferase family 39 protein [Clostridia bacterium]|nr:glycosyltransferase family 39 protein [Clostridia bacterium]
MPQTKITDNRPVKSGVGINIPGIFDKFLTFIYKTYGLFLVVLLVVSLFVRSLYNLALYDDKVIFGGQNIILLVITLLFIFSLVYLVFRFSGWLARFKPLYVVSFVLIVSAAVKIAFVLLFPANLVHDQANVNTAALQFLSKDFSSLQKGNYLYAFPNNLGFTLYLSFLYSIFPKVMLVPKIANILFSTLTCLLIYLVYGEFNKEKGYQYGVLILACLFLPAIMMNNFVYNDVVATFFFLLTVYLTVRFVNSSRYINLVGAGAALALGNFFRSLGPVFLVAIIIYFIVRKISIKNFVISVALMVCLMLLPNMLVSSYYESKGIINEPIGSNSMPSIMWVCMGMNEEFLGFWDWNDSYSVYFDKAKLDKKLSEDLYKEKIKGKIEKIGTINLIKMYAKKVFWMWTEGTYQTNYYGFGHHFVNGYSYSTPLTEMFQDKSDDRDTVMWIVYVTNLLLLLLAAFYSLKIEKRGRENTVIFVLVLIGFTLFYTFWEIKSRYIFICYPYLIVFAGLGYRKFKEDCIDKLLKKV